MRVVDLGGAGHGRLSGYRGIGLRWRRGRVHAGRQVFFWLILRCAVWRRHPGELSTESAVELDSHCVDRPSRATAPDSETPAACPNTGPARHLCRRPEQHRISAKCETSAGSPATTRQTAAMLPEHPRAQHGAPGTHVAACRGSGRAQRSSLGGAVPMPGSEPSLRLRSLRPGPDTRAARRSPSH
ncbi:hypothetical protein DL89DRAFT_182884 [Linderina pennispora]|uniref:Uncharacterized protein n=1 Tax=Linderina pennispora TaxID=61395 RepID=A0A1Y1W5C1_9FUNG|nr:uncharacterized protein DL89DRAFT_182884 [Linderina pennispora]ORX68720.1 hypothetical protein DL89DRAFT_182884 [Linderina pennispora]